MSLFRFAHRPARLLSAAAVLVAMTVTPMLISPRTASAAAPTHNVSINATALSTDQIHIFDITTSTDYGDQVSTSALTLSLQEGVYRFSTSSNFVCQPTLTSGGTWSVPSSCGAAASGDGTANLDLGGLPVTVHNTDGLSTGVYAIVGLDANPLIHPGTSATLQLMPSTYLLVGGSGIGLSCGLTVDSVGNATLTDYGAPCGAGEWSSSGAAVALIGFPVSIDAGQLSTTQYILQAADLETTLTPSGTVNSYRLMSTYSPTYNLQIGASAGTPWGVNANGLVYFPSTESGYMAGANTSTVIVRGLTVTVNATALGAGSFQVVSPSFGSPFDQSVQQTLHLVPINYVFTTTSAAPPTFSWTVTTAGAVTLPVPTPACAFAAGSVLYVDCSTPPTFTHVGGSFNPSLAGESFKLRGVECDRVANVKATGKLTFTDVTTGLVLGRASLTGGTAFANCSQATVTDTENLAQGSYTIKAVYTPGGATPIPTSAAATYTQIVQ